MTTEEASSPPPDAPLSSDRPHPPALYVFALLSSAVVLILLLRPRRAPRAYDQPIPYVLSGDFSKYLRLFSSQPRHKELLVVHGALGVGKTRGLTAFSRELVDSFDRLVFSFDFKAVSRFSTLGDFVGYVQSVVVGALREFDGRQAKYGEFWKAAQIIEAYATIDGPLNETAVLFKDANYQKILASLLTIVERIRVNPINAMKTFILSLEALSQFRPVMIVHDITDLRTSECEQVRLFHEAFWKVVDLYVDDSQELAIIVEVSDDIAIVDGSIPTNSDKIRFYCVREFNDAEARKVLVDGKIFPKKVYQFISDKVGFHGQTYATMYDMIKEGIDPLNAYKRLYQHTVNLLETVLRSNVAPGVLNHKLKFIKQLVSSKVLPLSYDTEAALSLLKWKAISLINSTHCTFPNKLIAQAAKDIH